MYCQQCGKELPQGSGACPACGYASGTTSSSAATFDQLLKETKHAAKDLAATTAQLSKRLLAKARTAAKDPPGSAKKAAHRAAEELESAAREIDRILKDL